MFGVSVKTQDRMRVVANAAKKAVIKTIGRAAGALRKDVAASIENAPVGKASPAGKPVNAHRRAFFRRAVIYSIDQSKQSAVVGPRHSAVGDVGNVHEFGGERKKQKFPPRPFMAPGLKRIVPRFAGMFSGSIGE